MSRLIKLLIVLTMLTLLGFSASRVDAATVIIGSTDSGSRYPIGLDPASATSAFPDFVAGGVYQQVYAGGSFPGPITITQIAFASNGPLTIAPGTATYNFNLALSTTAAVPNGLSTNFAANRGGDFAGVFSGPITANITDNDQFDVVIDITPFTYDPAEGNLLLEVNFNSPTQFTGGAILYFRAGSRSDTSRAASATGDPGGAFTDSFGLQTRFTTLPPTAATATISGKVTDETGAPLSGVRMRLASGTPASTLTDENGRYSFENVDVGNLYTVKAEFGNYQFTPANLSFSLLGNKTDADFIGSHDPNESLNVIDSNDYFVRQQYLDFLGREPDRQGLDYWTGKLNECNLDADCLRQRRIDVSAAFFKSVEFQQSGSYISRLYAGALGRQLSYAEFVADRRRVVGGANLDADKISFVREFVTRSEFLEKYKGNTSAESFVDALLQMQLIAGVDLTNDRDELVRRYNSGHTLNESRARALFNVAESPDFVSAVYNPTFVQMEYFGYLRRDIDRSGYGFWLNVLNAQGSGNDRGMVCSFITSAEYQRRFGAVVTHNNTECGG